MLKSHVSVSRMTLLVTSVTEYSEIVGMLQFKPEDRLTIKQIKDHE